METLQILQEHLLATFEALGKFFRHFPGTLQYSLDTHKILRSSGYILETLQILIYRTFDRHSSTLKKPWGKIGLISTIRFSNTQEDILNTFCKNWKYIWNTHRH